MQREVAFLMGGKWDSQDVFSLGVATGEEREGRYTSPRGLESVWSRMWAKRLELVKWCHTHLAPWFPSRFCPWAADLVLTFPPEPHVR